MWKIGIIALWCWRVQLQTFTLLQQTNLTSTVSQEGLLFTLSNSLFIYNRQYDFGTYNVDKYTYNRDESDFELADRVIPDAYIYATAVSINEEYVLGVIEWDSIQIYTPSNSNYSLTQTITNADYNYPHIAISDDHQWLGIENYYNVRIYQWDGSQFVWHHSLTETGRKVGSMLFSSDNHYFIIGGGQYSFGVQIYEYDGSQFEYGYALEYSSDDTKLATLSNDSQLLVVASLHSYRYDLYYQHLGYFTLSQQIWVSAQPRKASISSNRVWLLLSGIGEGRIYRYDGNQYALQSTITLNGTEDMWFENAISADGEFATFAVDDVLQVYWNSNFADDLCSGPMWITSLACPGTLVIMIVGIVLGIVGIVVLVICVKKRCRKDEPASPSEGELQVNQVETSEQIKDTSPNKINRLSREQAYEISYYHTQ